MKSYFIISTLLFLGVIITFTYYKIRSSYREYCRLKDIEDQVKYLKMKIEGARKYFQKNYSDGLNRELYYNLEPKINLSLTLIEPKSNTEKIKLLDKLFAVLYETGVRIKQNSIDVNLIISPLNNFITEILEENLKK